MSIPHFPNDLGERIVAEGRYRRSLEDQTTFDSMVNGLVLFLALTVGTLWESRIWALAIPIYGAVTIIQHEYRRRLYNRHLQRLQQILLDLEAASPPADPPQTP